MSTPASEWKAKVTEFSCLLKTSTRDEDVKRKASELLETLNGFPYPLANLDVRDAEALLSCVLQYRRVLGSDELIHVAAVISKLYTQQKITLALETQSALLSLLLSSLPHSHPPTELLYASSALLQAGTPPPTGSHDPQQLVRPEGGLWLMLFGSQCDVLVQRAALEFVTILCGKAELSRVLLLSLLEASVQCLLAPPKSTPDPLLQAKLVLSLLRCVQVVVGRVASLQSTPLLPTLLATLKANMALGLPGQARNIATIQPPLNVPQLGPAPATKPPTVAGPHHHRKKHRNKPHPQPLPPSSTRQLEPAIHSSSDSESGDQAPPTPPRRHHRAPHHPHHPHYSSSDSEVSDSESAPGRTKAVNMKIRLTAHSCLAVIFKSLDRHTAFSYWPSVLPDAPRPAHAPPSLLTCIIKDPSPKCRSSAIAVLCVMLDGASSYLAVADDKPLPSQPFTPYSTTVGSIVRELHRSLLLAATTEANYTTLTQVVRCLAILVASSPYHKLSEGYIRRVFAALQRLRNHRDTDVRVACLTCYGALVSLSPPLKEVELCLAADPEEGSCPTPWLVHHTTSLLRTQCPVVIRTESLQVLTALAKFYFSSMSVSWQVVTELYFTHLSTATSDPLKQHSLKMLEEVCRALATSHTPSPPNSTPNDHHHHRPVTQLWERLLSGPLALLLQQPSGPTPSLCAQACNVLATIGDTSLHLVAPPCQLFAITVILGLCREESLHATVTASAARVLGVFVSYKNFRENETLLLDCCSALLHCTSSSALLVRVQASWGVANLTDPLPTTLTPSHISRLYEAVCKHLKDNEKVKCNGVRSAGNLLKGLDEETLSRCSRAVEELCCLLVKCVNTGTMKSRWNACYACHSALSSALFTTHCPQPTKDLLAALCTAVQTCKNFKVRSNAALALGSPQSYGEGVEGCVGVWEAVMGGLEKSEHQEEFSEYKHASTLKTQLCTTLCHILSVMTLEEATAISLHPLPETLRQHFSEFLQRQVDSQELQAVVQKAYKKSRELLAADVQGAIKEINDLFVAFFEVVGAPPPPVTD